MDVQSEPGPRQIKVSQLPPTARNLYNKLRRIDGRIIRSKNRLLILRNHLNPITYGILPFRQLRGGGGGFLARIQKTRLQLTD